LESLDGTKQIPKKILRMETKSTAKRILIVDDEDQNVDLFSKILSLDGHLVDTANDGNKALAKISTVNYDLILMDIRMPGLDGRQVYMELSNDRPDVAKKIVFSTGDTVSEDTRSFLEKSGNYFINKPFGVEELQQFVRTALGSVGSDETLKSA